MRKALRAIDARMVMGKNVSKHSNLSGFRLSWKQQSLISKKKTLKLRLIVLISRWSVLNSCWTLAWFSLTEILLMLKRFLTHKSEKLQLESVQLLPLMWQFQLAQQAWIQSRPLSSRPSTSKLRSLKVKSKSLTTLKLSQLTTRLLLVKLPS